MTSNSKTFSPPRPRPRIKPLGLKPTLVIATLFVIGVLLIVGIPYWDFYIAPWREPVLQVGDKTVSMKQFMKRFRLRTSPGQKDQLSIAMTVIQELQRAMLIRQEAEKRNFTATDAELEAEVKARVKASGANDAEYEEQYESLLRGLRLSQKEFLEMVKDDIYKLKLLEGFKQDLRKEVEQVQVLAILIGNAYKAELLRRRILAGEDFSQIAKDESIDLSSSKKGGDLGWFPKNIDQREVLRQVHTMGILLKTEDQADQVRDMIVEDGRDFGELAEKYTLDDTSRPLKGYLGWVSTDYRQGGKQYASMAFDLKPGEISDPLDTSEGFWIIKILEKIDEGKLIDDFAFSLNTGQLSPPLPTAHGVYLIKLAGRQLDSTLSDEQIDILARKAMSKWVLDKGTEETKKGNIKWFWGSEPYNWAMGHL